MAADLRALRKFVFDYFYEHARAPVLEEMVQSFGLSRKEAYEGLRLLEADHHILLLPGTQRILMANPYSGITTPFRVHIGGRHYFANCAWDTVSLHVMLGKDARVESYCHHCAEPIGIRLSRGRVVSSTPARPLILLSVPVSKWYDNLVNTCSNNMVYFSSKKHMDNWLADNPGLKGEALTPEKMVEVCKPLSKGRMDLDYQRPPKQELMEYWASIGLKSEFWKF
jgi:hypothetical protein